MFNPLKNRITILVFFISVSLSFTLLYSGNPFFWDAIIQVSVPANWYYDNNFGHLFLPDQYATGHSTMVGFYLAFVWKIFGRTLVVSHFSMLPFVFGIL